MKLEPKHWAVIAGLITGVATQLLTAQHGWVDIATPGFVAGLLIQVASAISAIFVGAPGATAALDRANMNTDMANASTRAALAEPMDLGRVDPKRFVGPGASVLLACALAASSVACTGRLSPKVSIDVSDRTAYSALLLFDRDEDAAYHAKVITPAQHQAISAKLSQLYQGVVDVANIGINLPAGGALSAADLVKINGLALSVTDLASLIAPSAGAALQADYAAFLTKVSALINAVKGLPS